MLNYLMLKLVNIFKGLIIYDTILIRSPLICVGDDYFAVLGSPMENDGSYMTIHFG